MAPLTNGVVSQQTLAPIPGSTEPMTPVRVKTLQVKAGPMKVASAGPTQIVPQPNPPQVIQPQVIAPQVMQPQVVQPQPAATSSAVMTSTSELPKSNTVAKSDLAPINPNYGKGQGILGTLPANAVSSNALAYADPARATAPAPAPQPVLAAAPAQPQAAAPAAKAVDASKPSSARPGSWIIQVGALESEAEAKSRLNEAREAGRTVLGKASRSPKPWPRATSSSIARASPASSTRTRRKPSAKR